MKITIDTDTAKVQWSEGGKEISTDLYSNQAFKVISDCWVKSSWGLKYSYSFSWMGRPVIQLPEDMIRTQEVIYKVKPDVILETGIAHGGSLIYYASLCKAMGHGRVIGVDIEIRPHNRKAIEEHELFEYITLIEGSSIDDQVVEQVDNLVNENEKAIVILDSNHTKDHVLAELEAYSHLVSVDSYIVATDGIMYDLAGAPGSNDDWAENNPKTAAEEFAKKHDNFEIDEPAFPFNEGGIKERITYWPGAFLRRIS